MTNCKKYFKAISLLFASAFLAACSHPITITPSATPDAEYASSDKKVAYVLTDVQRNQKVTTPGGGGDKVDYYPYRDLEKGIRDALRSVYKKVVVIDSVNYEKTSENNFDLVYVPDIKTQSSSSSIITWPPTDFKISLNCTISNPEGKHLTNISVTSEGQAEFSEFLSDFGLSGRRAANQMSEELRQAILQNEKLL